ncbi:mediator of RNA polymerase II transcription subunit 8-like isoform X2 [Anneissia japonica]|uniref:mediator of RNA polymerase II transcription subunit 8-like isoform X2 n=1 Tax=Anneissia japonica TaxID=1529436 RepID=UPI001425A706|nr:mediator of RNA polymerase II transcription subunit 8-like isoform X2 [Anneissia japonica]
MQQNTVKAFETSLDLIMSRVQDLKHSIGSFILKLEHEHQMLNWPSVLDSFALLSSQINMLNKVLKGDKTPSLRNMVLLPLELSLDRDEDLEKLTEGRVPVFNHDVVPNYLRTKPEPEIESKNQQRKNIAAQITPELAQKQINSLNKITGRLLDHLNTAKEDWETDSSSSRLNMTTDNRADTQSLVGTIALGKGIKQVRQQTQPTPSQAVMQQPRHVDQHIHKPQSTVRTHIRPGSSVHPYNRT